MAKQNAKGENLWSHSIENITKNFKTNIKDGLSLKEVQNRLKKFGPNKLPEQEEISKLLIFLKQFSSIIVWTLIGAMIILFFLGEWVDAIAIGVIVVVNAIIGFAQEYKAERSIAALKKLTKLYSVVLRDGETKKILSQNIVPGDILLLEAGDKVPADGRIISSIQLATQEASLTGESTPVYKTSEAINKEKLLLADRKNMAFMGTIVVKGKGRMIVTQTGSLTQLGKVADMLKTEPEEKTPLEIQLEKTRA